MSSSKSRGLLWWQHEPHLWHLNLTFSNTAFTTTRGKKFTLKKKKEKEKAT